ncbi:MAG: FtsW/RodA/SpoVE family cell cycle protein [Prevotellaceae bacterium]|jgi:cell division protein FtsW|nr:FtsW/RodA/SpoVE family cell cycle protein [Prevotellaceae bacterium]
MKDFLQKYFKGDAVVWTVFIALIFLSAIAMYSASSTLAFKQSDYNSPVWRHIVFLTIGFVFALIVHIIPYKIFPVVGTFLAVVSIALLIVTLIMGVSANNAARWLEIGGIQFQPSELAKLAVIIILAVVLGRKQQEKQSADDAFKWSMIILAIACILIFPENFSTAALLFIVGLLMMFFGRISLKKLGKTVGFIAGFCLLLYLTGHFIPKETAKDIPGLHRLSTWIGRIDSHFTHKTNNGLKDFVITDDNYQVAHAKIAIANSNGFGRGPGNSIERDFLPQAYSDFIFAIIIEETGFFGAIFVMFLYLVLLFRAGVIANKCPSAFPALLVLGLASMIVIQAFLNMAVAVGLAPVTGQPLPMVSRGGTSILITAIYFGIILSVSRYAKEEAQKQEITEGKTKTKEA